MDIVLHAGLPKTGSTATQQILWANRTRLAEGGILYDPQVQSEQDPKHQWLIRCLRDPKALARQDFRRAAGYRTFLLSTESIANELPLLDPGHVAAVGAALRNLGTLSVVLVTRDPLVWGKSYYKQAIVNQQSDRIAIYGTALTYQDFARQPQVARLLDHESLAAQLGTLFQAPVRTIPYGPGAGLAVASALSGGLPLEVPQAAQTRNRSIDDETAEILRQLNAQMQTAGQKAGWSRVIAAATGADSAVLQTLASRATPDDMAALDLRVLDGIEAVPNPPLSIDGARFAELLDRMRGAAGVTP